MYASWIALVWIFLNLLASGSGFGYTDTRRSLPNSSHENRVYPPAPNTDSFWSSWAEWYPCTRTCGSGISSRVRFCQPRSKSRIDSCHGETKQFRVCNTQLCPPDGLDFRQRQCAAYNNKHIAGEFTRRWMPAQGHHGCELKCRSADHGTVYTFGKAKDATSCHKSDKHVCLNGRCMEVGCDLLLGSNRRLDVCGVCGGRNDTCALVRGRYDVGSYHGRKKVSEKGYEEVARVPAGSTRIHVTDNSEQNFLALADSSQRFVVNGGRDISWPGSYPVAGTNLNYSRQWQGETFIIPGPTREDLYLMLLVYDKSGPPVRYEYWEPSNPRSSGQRPVYPRHPGRPRDPPLPTTSTIYPSRSPYPTRPSSQQDTTKEERDHNRPYPVPTRRQQEPQRPEFPREGPGRNPDDFNKYGDPYGHRDPRLQGSDGVSPPSTSNDPRYYPEPVKGTEDRKEKKPNKDRKKEVDQVGKATGVSTRRGRCPRCKRINEKVRNFCESDFVIRTRVLDIETVSGETRYDLGIVESYKNTMFMSHREYVWSRVPEQGPPECRCPRLRKNQEYILMGRFDRNYKRGESRLLITPESFVRKSNPKRDQELKNLKSVSNRKCK